MNKHIYEKIALTNMRKNGKIYLPYVLTVIGSLMLYFFLTSIGSNPNIYDLSTGKEAFQGAMTLCGIIQSAAFAISFLADALAESSFFCALASAFASPAALAACTAS